MSKEIDMVDTMLIFLTSLGTAYVANRLSQRGRFTLADLSIGMFSGIVSMSIAQVLSAEGNGWGWGLPLLFACGLAIGLGSLQRPSALDTTYGIHEGHEEHE